MMEREIWAPLLLAVAACLGTVHLPWSGAKFGRPLLAAAGIFFYLRYYYWRVCYSMPTHQNRLQHGWALLFLSFETFYILSNCLVLFFLSRHRSRSAEADLAEKSPLRDAPTDIFIATYNESRDILERTIVGALAVLHQDLRVWVLDDGNRAWVRDLAESHGALYTSRIKGKHAKAGNVNHGLEIALEIGRKPQFVLLLDADFIPNQRILARTLGLFEDPTVGIVQTPQHFFNFDPIQTNLLKDSVWPDEQRFFFNVLLPSKDAWGAAFCCGTSAILRVKALQVCGGMAIETVTEDMLTTFRMSEYGYKTILLDEPLSMGLAPEGLAEYISQRSRWCLGAIQQLFTRWSFQGRARMGWVHRLSFFDSIIHWVAGAIFRVMLLTAPLVYWWTGTSVIQADPGDLVCWMLPATLVGTYFMCHYGRMYILPIVNDITQILIAVPVIQTVVIGLIRPFGQPFKVTAKGISSDRVTVHWQMVGPLLLLAGLSVIGMLLRLPAFSHLHGAPGYNLNIIWTLLNAAVMTLAALIGVELPRRRRDERFLVSRPVTVLLDNGVELPCTLQDISLGGALLSRQDGWSTLVGTCMLRLESGNVIEFTPIRRFGQSLALRFNEDKEVRQTLIVELFTGRYSNDVDVIHPVKVFGRLLHRLVFA